MGASSAFYLMIRAGLLDGTESASTFLKDAQDAKNNTLAEGIIENLVFAESKSVRTSTVILAAFNVLASFATAASILYDSYWASKRCNPKFKASQFCVSMIHPAETFPLVLSIGIVIQGIIFAAVQGEGLNSLFTSGCSIIAQFMWIDALLHFYAAGVSLVRNAPQTPTESFPSEHTRKQSYSLFPAPALQSPNTLLPPRMNRSAFESVYDISDLSDLEAPPSLQGKRGHRRGSSVASSATVQIGIRFSHAPPPPAVPGMLPIAVPSSTDKASGLPASTFQALALPPTTYAPTSKFNPATQTTSAPPRILLPPIKTTNLAKNIIPIPPRSPFRPSVDTNTATQQFPKRSNPSRINSPQQSPSYINKTLPATPKPIAPKQPAIERLEQSKAIIQLSPTVYTPPKSLLQRNGSAKAVLPGSDFNRRDSKFGQASRDQWI
ncbi:hypothetical protein SS1G_09067 [Sclerotinia sclerotiorum 1980 UF-70]|uniref:Uncharacterized protein n=1 Tax=Sclerotinia sclerotiorum (strain ATCC 18683 / 1980 / Ss-1) TaxID=665079 RepID=A7EUQ9_SCLS1|nr:hypothetical protein SS1G_09067 [Sclerotinia sclerotiorum 1980 UF-70]EDN93201.1 hypothetical protein SS1G_09067 [Sclerotinia sclerotiorum 1980 UF-70]